MLCSIVLSVVFVISVVVQPAFASAAEGLRPNIIFILADDWGLGDVGAYHTLLAKGIDKPATPNLDRLAREGTLFTDFHTLGAECSPSRASWVTGRSPSDKAVRIHLVIGDHANNANKGCADYLNTSTPTIMSTLASQGYSVGHYGKWHIGDNKADPKAGVLAAPSPKAYGVEKSRCYVCNPDDPNDPSTSYDLGDTWFPSNSSRLIVDDVLTHIDNATSQGRPFYINMWFHISHAPMLPTQNQLDAYATFINGGKLPPTGAASLCNNMANDVQFYPTCASLVYRASQFEADAQIGRLLSNIRANQSLDNNTLVIFSTDNGPEDPHIYMNSKVSR